MLLNNLNFDLIYNVKIDEIILNIKNKSDETIHIILPHYLFHLFLI